MAQAARKFAQQDEAIPQHVADCLDTTLLCRSRALSLADKQRRAFYQIGETPACIELDIAGLLKIRRCTRDGNITMALWCPESLIPGWIDDVPINSLLRLPDPNGRWCPVSLENFSLEENAARTLLIRLGHARAALVLADAWRQLAPALPGATPPDPAWLIRTLPAIQNQLWPGPHTLEALAGKALFALWNRIMQPTRLTRMAAVLVRNLPPRQRRNWIAHLGEYRALENNLGMLEQLGKETPQWMPLLHRVLIRRQAGIRLNDASLADLKKQLIDAGLTPAGWRWIGRCHADTVAAMATLDIVPLANALATAKLQNDEMVGQIIENSWCRTVLLPDHASPALAPTTIRQAHLFLIARAVQQEPVQSEQLLAYLAAEYPERLPLPVPRQKSAATLLRHAGRWQREHFEAWFRLSGSSSHWSVWLAPETIDGILALPLANAAELAAEGVAMRNCAARYRARCAAGHTLLFSLRDASSGRRIATLEIIYRNQSWIFQQIRGPGNVNLPPDHPAHRVACQLAENTGKTWRRALGRGEAIIPVNAPTDQYNDLF